MMNFQTQAFCFLLALFSTTQTNGNQPKRMFALCPPHFFPIVESNQCYFISGERVNWLDAHFECRDRKSRLAEPLRKEDRFLRKHLNHFNGSRPDDTWIGARFNWERNKWQWGYEGKDLTYQSFSQMSAENKDLKFHCAILKPGLKYRWSASSCEQQHQYICQHGIRYVTDKNRQEIYKKWNETYPNEMANEFEHKLSRDDLLRWRRKKSRSHQKSGVNNRQMKEEQNNRQRNDIQANEIQQSHMQNPPRKIRKGNRLRNNKQFELNRNHADGIREPIDFRQRSKQNRTNDHGWRHKQRLPTMNTYPTFRTMMMSSTTAAPTTTTTTTTAAKATTTTTAFRPGTWTSNDVNHFDDRYAENARRTDNSERERFLEHQMQEDLRRKQQIEAHKTFYQTESNRPNEFNQQRNVYLPYQHAVQTNEILDNTAAAAGPTTNPNDEKKVVRDRLRKRLGKLSPEDKSEFFKRRAERKNKKRGIKSGSTTEPSHSH